MSLRSHIVAVVVASALGPVNVAGAAASRAPIEGPEPAPPRSAPAERTNAASRQGAGLIAAGALVAGLGFAANLVRVSQARKLCDAVSYNSATRTVSGTDLCFSDTQVMLFLGPGALVLNTAAFGLVAGGSHVHGRWAAQWRPDAERRPRRGGGQIAAGALVLAGGLIGYGVTRVVSYVDMLGFNTCSARHGLGLDAPDPANSPLTHCVRERFSGYLVGITLTQLASVVGVGVLAHGASFRRHSRAYEFATNHRLRLRPVLSPMWSGVSLSGSF